MHGKREWTLKRNCSITPHQLLAAYGALCAASLTVAGFFTWHGGWFVLCFAVLELAAVGLAFVLCARHATDRERIALDDQWLLIELIDADHARQYRLDAHATRIDPPSAHHQLITVREHGTRIEIGRFLTIMKRHQFALELRSALMAR